jgi:hypothetical protein
MLIVEPQERKAIWRWLKKTFKQSPLAFLIGCALGLAVAGFAVFKATTMLHQKTVTEMNLHAEALKKNIEVQQQQIELYQAQLHFCRENYGVTALKEPAPVGKQPPPQKKGLLKSVLQQPTPSRNGENPAEALQAIREAEKLAEGGYYVRAFSGYARAYRLVPDSVKRRLDQNELSMALSIDDLNDLAQVTKALDHFRSVFGNQGIIDLLKGGERR